MKLIVGLGNPDEKFTANRHNAGFLFLDELAKKGNLSFEQHSKLNAELVFTESHILAKPRTFMNRSGIAVKKLLSFYKISPDDLFVVHDDLDLRLGEYKLQFDRGPKEHFGMTSIEESVKKPFWRLRLGIDNRNSLSRVTGESYVLQDFTEEEKNTLKQVIIQTIPILLEKLA